jgi:putative hemolysin
MNGTDVSTSAGGGTQARTAAPFRLPRRGSRLFDSLLAPVEEVLGLGELNRIYGRLVGIAPDEFCSFALRDLSFSAQFDGAKLDAIPRSGPLVIVANHPFGGIDGLAALDLISKVRPDVKLLANHLLRRIPQLGERCFFVDPFDRKDSRQRNIASMRAAARWVSDGNALIVFPAGEVAHATWSRWSVSDGTWKENIGRLILRAKAAVLPIFFDGRNSGLFHAAGLVNAWLRTVMLPREMLAKRNGVTQVEIGSVIPPQRLASMASATDVMSYLRVRTFMLRGRSATAAQPAERVRSTGAPITAGPSVDAMLAEIEALPPNRILATQGKRMVVAALAPEIPQILDEIGRLREITFREVGEGTGRPRDLDRFDCYYTHLFVWDQERRGVVGAYRIGQVDEIVSEFGVEGLYTHTLFRYRSELIDQIGPSLELGRSFVIPDCQRSYWPLLLLWRGIGRYLSERPRYRHLFGPVSISDEYQSMSKRILIAFLERSRCGAPLARLLAPRTPVPQQRSQDWSERQQSLVVDNLEEVDSLVRELESGQRGIPILVRQYLKLNAKVLGFNVDPDFGNAIDALVLIDLTKVDRRIMNLYMGSDEADAFLRHSPSRS